MKVVLIHLGREGCEAKSLINQTFYKVPVYEDYQILEIESNRLLEARCSTVIIIIFVLKVNGPDCVNHTRFNLFSCVSFSFTGGSMSMSMSMTEVN